MLSRVPAGKEARCMEDDTLPLDVPSCLRAAAAGLPDAEAVVDGDLRLTWAGLSARVDEFARALIAAGVQPGEKVSIWAPNSARWIVAALGTFAAGAVLVPVNTRYKGAEAHFSLDRARVALLVVDQGFLGNDYLGMLRSAGPLAALRTVITMTDDGYARFLAAGAAIDPGEVDKRIWALRPDSLCDIMFTSGTSGAPKGVMATHAGAVRTSAAWADGVGLRAGDRYLIVNPLFHSFGYRAGMLASVITRATMFPQAVFDVETTLRIAQAEQITVLPGPPTLYHSILDHPRLDEFALSVRLVATGATSVPEALMYRIRDELHVETVTSPYGLTESTSTATICPPDASVEKMSTTVGTAIPGTEVSVVDSSGRPLPPGEDGEIAIRGFNVMLGYFEDPVATAEAIDAGGWLHTGDIGHLDEEGYLTVTGRLKELFQTGGFNVYPVEVEQMLSTPPMIAETAIIGVPDARLGEVAHAFVVAEPGSTLTAADVIAYARERMANFKVPRGVTFLPELPH